MPWSPRAAPPWWTGSSRSRSASTSWRPRWRRPSRAAKGLGGGLRPPSEPPPRNRLRRQSRRSKASIPSREVFSDSLLHEIAPHDSECSRPRGGCGWRRVRPRAAGRSGTPEARPQLEELRTGEWVTEPGRPGAHTTTGPAAATPTGAVAPNHGALFSLGGRSRALFSDGLVGSILLGRGAVTRRVRVASAA